MERVRIALKNIPGLMWGSLVILIVFAIYAKNFTATKNIENILKNSSILIIASTGMTLAILSAKLDYSVGGVMTFSGMVAALYIRPFGEQIGAGQIITALLIGIGVGLVFGLFNGILISIFRFNYLLITFAVMSIAYGASQALTNGKIVAGYGARFRDTLSSGTLIGNIPNIIIISLAIVLTMSVILKQTRFGMHIYAVGDSEQCALQSGIRVRNIKLAVYAISGALSGLAGVLLIARTNSASPILANGYEWDAIAAVVVGGTSFTGGKGSIWGTVFGAIIIAAVKSGLQLIGLSSYWQQTFVGLFIMTVIVTDVVSARRRKTQSLRRVYRT